MSSSDEFDSVGIFLYNLDVPIKRIVIIPPERLHLTSFEVNTSENVIAKDELSVGALLKLHLEPFQHLHTNSVGVGVAMFEENSVQTDESNLAIGEVVPIVAT
jgi:hypothetical protein